MIVSMLSTTNVTVIFKFISYKRTMGEEDLKIPELAFLTALSNRSQVVMTQVNVAEIGATA